MTTIVDADGKPFETGIYELTETVENPSADKRYRHAWIYHPTVEKGRRFECQIRAGNLRSPACIRLIPIGAQSEIRVYTEGMAAGACVGEASTDLSRMVMAHLRKSKPQSVEEVIPGWKSAYGHVIDQLVKDGKITFADVKEAFDRWHDSPEE